MQVESGSATVKFEKFSAELTQSDAAWTQKKLAIVGDVIYLKILSLGRNGRARVSLEQLSGAQGALVALDNVSGEIKAMVGGRDFHESKFNRAVQAQRSAVVQALCYAAAGIQARDTERYDP